MNSNLLSWLTKTGLDEQRAELYLATLSKGEATAAELADAMKMRRTAIYDNLRILESRGYVQTIKHGKRIAYVALHPKELKKRFDNLGDQLKDLLPDFLSLYAGKSKTPFTQTFQGPHAAREVLADILNVAKNEYVYFSPQSLTAQTLDRAYIKKWIENRVKKGLRSRSLRVQNKNVNDPLFTKEAEYLRQIRYLPAYVDLKTSIYIYENNIGLISSQNEGMAFIIHSPDLAFSLKQIFEFLWSVSSTQI
ncbi:MAG: helix-turn-helix domain-containing protein [bacterium]